MTNIATGQPGGTKRALEVSPGHRYQQRHHKGRSFRFLPRPAYVAAIVLMSGFIFPSNFVLPLGGAVTMLTLALFVLAVAIFPFAREKMSTGGFVLIASDVLLPAAAAWMMMSMFVHDGVRGLIGNGGIAAVQLVLAYLVGRIFFGTPAGLSQFLRVLRVAVVITLLLALVDTATGTQMVGKLAGSVFHHTSAETSAAVSSTQIQYRMGVVRARGAFEQPILLGLFFSMSLILHTSNTNNAAFRLLIIILCCFGLVLTLSSAPFLGVGIYVIISLAANTFRPHKWRWTLVWLALVYGVALLLIFVDDPIRAVINNLTFEPQTGLFRMLIWKWVGINLSHSPCLGSGFKDWIRPDEMPPSVDALWLLHSLRYGYPGAALLFLSVVGSFVALPLRRAEKWDSVALANARSSLGIILLVMTLLAFTVHYWGTAWVWLGLMIGMRAGASESLFLSPIERGDALIYQPQMTWRSVLPAKRLATPRVRYQRPVGDT